MSKTKTIKGKIIRILDRRTVIINLGARDGVDQSTVFRILAEPEKIIDPDTDEVLGSVNVVKSKLKAKTVNEKFTIASTNWVESRMNVGNLGVWNEALSGLTEYETVDHGKLNVDEDEIEPWKAKSEIPVRKGDVVEANVKVQEEELETGSEDEVDSSESNEEEA